MNDYYLNRAYRLNRKSQRLANKTCLLCGCNDEEVLQNVTLCANCRKELQGQSPIENHHFPGRKWSSFIFPLIANDHTILTGRSYDHPRQAQQDPTLAGLYTRLDFIELRYQQTQAEIEKYEENNARPTPTK